MSILQSGECVNNITVGRGGGAISTNTAVGNGALEDNTTGNSNTASGFNALSCNTTGNYNTASGRGALSSNTTGNSNTASGFSAVACNTTGLSNTASGRGALSSNTTGLSNTASGRGALSSNTTGNYNTASGFNALSCNTTGVNNTATGAAALRCNTTGCFNTASGFNALRCNTTGVNNTAIGDISGCDITTGSSNTIIGSYTGNSAELDIRTSNNNVILSDGAGTISLRGVGNAIEIKAPTTANSATHIPVFTSSPTTDLSRIRTRNPAQLRGDIGAFSNTGGTVLGNVLVRPEENNDAMRIQGRAGGNGNLRVTLLPTTLTGNRNATFPDAGGTVAFTGSSDYRMKENIILSENAISRLNTLKVYRFNFKEEHILEEGLPTGLVDGFIAHELQEQMPEVVLGTKDQVDENGTPVYQSIDHAKMVPLLTASLQEALSEIELLKTRLTNAGL